MLTGSGRLSGVDVSDDNDVDVRLLLTAKKRWSAEVLVIIQEDEAGSLHVALMERCCCDSPHDEGCRFVCLFEVLCEEDEL